MKKTITPDEYRALQSSDSRYYSPEYAKYRIKKERSYSECDCCSRKEFMGWVEVKIPIGEPTMYKWHERGVMDVTMDALASMMADRLLSSNVLAARILGK